MASKNPALDDLIKYLNSNNQAYTQLSDSQMRQQAKDKYASSYAQKRLSANQDYQTQSAALERQLKQLGTTYDEQREQSAANYRQQYAAQNRNAVGYGMQRSSYNNAKLAQIDQAGINAQAAINKQQTQSEQNIAQQQSDLSSQLAQKLAEYDVQQLADEQAHYDTLAEREYQRGVDSRALQNQLATQIYEYQHQQEQEEEDRRRWEKEYNAAYGR